MANEGVPAASSDEAMRDLSVLGEIQSVRHLRKLSADWNSYGAEPVADAAIRAGEALISHASELLQPAYPTAWAIGALPDGGVSITWRFASHELYVEIDLEGVYSLLVETRPSYDVVAEREQAVLPIIVEYLRTLATSS